MLWGPNLKVGVGLQNLLRLSEYPDARKPGLHGLNGMSREVRVTSNRLRRFFVVFFDDS